MPRHYGHYLRILHWCTDQQMTHALMQMDLTASQGPILGYLSHRKEAPCPRDIEEAFRLSHPTVSGLLSRLEKKGFIEFYPDETDRRSKRIRLLNKGSECIKTMQQTIDHAEAQMVQGFSEEEQELFRQFLERAIANMGADPHKCKHKEETNP